MEMRKTAERVTHIPTVLRPSTNSEHTPQFSHTVAFFCAHFNPRSPCGERLPLFMRVRVTR